MNNRNRISNKLNEGTNNFLLDNASKYYTLPEYEDEDDVNDFISEELTPLMNRIADFESDTNIDVPDQNRSFPSVGFGTITKSFSVTQKIQNDYGKYDRIDNNFYITIYCYYNVGYYSGANLDWKLKVEDDLYNEYDSSDYSECEPRIVSYINKKISEIEKVYAKITTSLVKVGGFSDGTAVYQKG